MKRQAKQGTGNSGNEWPRSFYLTGLHWPSRWRYLAPDANNDCSHCGPNSCQKSSTEQKRLSILMARPPADTGVFSYRHFTRRSLLLARTHVNIKTFVLCWLFVFVHLLVLVALSQSKRLPVRSHNICVAISDEQFV